jgi:hypothetical protein
MPQPPPDLGPAPSQNDPAKTTKGRHMSAIPLASDEAHHVLDADRVSGKKSM